MSSFSWNTIWPGIALNPTIWLLPLLLAVLWRVHPASGLGAPRRLGKGVVPALAGLFAVWLCVLTWMRHQTIKTYGCDLGIFENVLWNTVWGRRWLHSAILNRHFFGEHVSPMLLLLAPLYALWSDARLLLVAQAVALAWAALPIYRVAARRLGPSAGLIVLFLYFSYIPLQGLYLFDFHEVAIALPLLAYAYEHMTRGHLRRMMLFLGLALMCKEELALTVIVFGMYLILFPRAAGPLPATASAASRRKMGLGLVISGVMLFLFLTSWVIPFFRQAPFPYVDRYNHLGNSLLEIAWTIITQPMLAMRVIGEPEKLLYINALFLPVLYLNLLSPGATLLLLPTLMRSVLSNHEPQYLLTYHFHGPLIPFVFFGLVAGLGRLLQCRWPGENTSVRCRAARRARMQSALLLLFVSGILFGSNPGALWRSAKSGSKRRPSMDRLLLYIQPGDSVCAHNSLAAQVAGRREVTVFPDVRQADWVLLDFGLYRVEYPLCREEHVRHFFRLVRYEDYGIRDCAGKFVLLERGMTSAGMDIAEVVHSLFLDYESTDLLHIPAKLDTKTLLSFPEIDHAAERLFPAGGYRVHYELEARRLLTSMDRLSLSVHPRWGEHVGEWSLADRAVTAADFAGGATVRQMFTLEFYTPTPTLLGLQVIGAKSAGVKVQRMVLEPLIPLPEFAEQMARAYEDTLAAPP